MTELRIVNHGGMATKTVNLVAAQSAYEGYACYFAAASSVRLVTDADAAAQAAIAIFAETLATADADRRPNRFVKVLVGKGVIKTDAVQADDLPVVGQKVYINDNAVFCATAANNREAGTCLAGVDGEGLYIIELDIA